MNRGGGGGAEDEVGGLTWSILVMLMCVGWYEYILS